MRQPLLFLLVGGIQYALDAALFAVLVLAGVAVTPANVSARAGAAAAGFLLNRYWTFGHRGDDARRVLGSLGRFGVLWVGMTVLSTLGIQSLRAAFGSEDTVAILAKLGVEAVLAVLSFVLSRYWVFRR